jgi:uncharacterized protein involved in type VI secretion and phage assembly
MIRHHAPRVQLVPQAFEVSERTCDDLRYTLVAHVRVANMTIESFVHTELELAPGDHRFGCSKAVAVDRALDQLACFDEPCDYFARQ